MNTGLAGIKKKNSTEKSPGNWRQATLCQGLDSSNAGFYDKFFSEKLNENKEVAMKKAVGYVRVSSQEQALQGLSLEAQRQKIEDYARFKGVELVGIVADEGLSGKNLRRPGAQKVLGLAKNRTIDAVIVVRLDRMFRSTIDALETTQRFDKWGIELHSLNETLDTGSAMGRFFITMVAALAALERETAGERTAMALALKKANGEKCGGDTAPFGWDADQEGLLIPNEKEQLVLSLIKDLRAEGLSLRSICRYLMENGFKTKRGNDAWHPEVIRQILKAA